MSTRFLGLVGYFFGGQVVDDPHPEPAGELDEVARLGRLHQIILGGHERVVTVGFVGYA